MQGNNLTSVSSPQALSRHPQQPGSIPEQGIALGTKAYTNMDYIML